DIPGLIEGASEGVGLGHEFLKHIERTRVLIHMVDAASTEGRDPIEDIYAINKELEKYNPEIAKRPQVIAANKMDAVVTQEPEAIDIDENGELIYSEAVIDPLTRIKNEFEPQGYTVFPISAVSGTGLKELLYHVQKILDETEAEPIIFEPEYFPEDEIPVSNEPFTVEYDADEEEYVVEGPRIEKMLGYTNLESEKGFQFFQKFMKENGILDQLEELGIMEGDTVRMYGLKFDYYKS
ncbi:MAG: Obg family GTPase CgtA, partial [Lachnospiraceae bacterium]|nr:Obg family GTPase CgtA [Lachnospiraceae bacterium]